MKFKGIKGLSMYEARPSLQKSWVNIVYSKMLFVYRGANNLYFSIEIWNLEM